MKQTFRLAAAAAALTVGGLVPTTAVAALRDGLVVHLPLDGNANDLSGRANHGSAVNSPTFGAGKLGQAVFVSNTIDPNVDPSLGANYISLGTPADLLFTDATDFSVAMWVQLNGFEGDPSFFANKNWNSGGNRGFVLATGGDRRIQWNYKEDASGRRDFDSAGDQLPAGTWVHVAMTVKRDGKITTYINGQSINATDARATVDTPASTIDTDDLGLSVNIGNDGTGQYTDGGSVFHANTGIDDVGIWRRELTASEIFRVYTYGQGGTNIVSVPEPTAAAVDSVAPSPGALNVSPSTALVVGVRNASTAVVPGSIRMSLNGTAVTPTVTTEGAVTTIRFQPASLFAAGSTNSFQVVFADNGTPARTTTNDVTFVVKNYVNLTLGTPFASENFDAVAEGALPAGWSVTNATAGATGELDLNNKNSDSYLDWVVINTTRVPALIASGASDGDLFQVAPDQFVNGAAVSSLLNGNFVLAQSTDRSAQQIQVLTSPDFNATGKSNVFLYFHGAHKANQDSLFAVEYSVDGGASWLPALIGIDTADIARNPDGSIDAVTTLTREQGDIPLADGSATGGGTFGAFLGSPITASLSSFISGRVNDDGTESKRVEFIRLAGADNKSRVRFRFVNVGTDSWYSAIDDVRLYTVTTIAPPQITTQPASTTVVQGQNTQLVAAASGIEPRLQWYRGTTLLPNATNSVLGLSTITLAQAGDYTVVASNAGGSVTSLVATVTVVPVLSDLSTVRAGLKTYLPFDGTYNDASGNGNDGTAVGSPTFAAGPVGSGAMVFTNAADGSSFNYVKLPASLTTGTSDFTVAFWAKFDSRAGDPPLVANKNWGSGSNDGWVIATDGDGRLQWNYRSKGDPRPTRKDYDGPGGTFAAGTWHHVVVSFAVNGNANTYLDGDLVDSRAIGPVGTGPDTTFPINIGQDGTGTYTDGGGVSSMGSIDEFALWGRALSGVEAASLYQANRGGTPLLTPAAPASQLAATLSNGSLVITITGGNPPFTVEGAATLGGTWSTVSTGSSRTVTVPVDASARFIRVKSAQ